MDDRPTEPHYPVWGEPEEEEDEPTEEIEVPPLLAAPPPPPVEPPPYIVPPPPPLETVKNPPVQSARREPVNPAYDRGRGGIAALCFAALILGGLLGFIISSYTTAQEFANMPPKVQVKMQTATATATATKTKKVTKTVKPEPVRVTEPAPPRATVTQRVIVPKPGSTKTVTRTKTKTKTQTPQSCLNALDAADQYLQLARQGRGRGNDVDDSLLQEARQNFRYWSDVCQSKN
jgi:hypothetical protein